MPAGNYRTAARHLAFCQEMKPRGADIAFYRAVVSLLAGHGDKGRELLRRAMAKASPPAPARRAVATLQLEAAVRRCRAGDRS
jgi:hypothetical protein